MTYEWGPWVNFRQMGSPCWTWAPGWNPIISYQVRRPLGMTMLNAEIEKETTHD